MARPLWPPDLEADALETIRWRFVTATAKL